LPDTSLTYFYNTATMANYEPSSDFHNAAAYLSSASSLAQVSTAVKLEVYVFVRVELPS